MYQMTQHNGQMDKAKQLTTIALNDPNISKEDKKEFANWLRFQSRGDGLHDEARGLVDLGGTDLRRARLPNSSEIPAHNFSTAPPQVTISGVTGYTSTGIGPSFDVQLQASRLLGSHPSLGGVAPPQDSLTASLHIFTSRPWRSNSLTPPGCVAQQDWQPPYPPQSPKGRSNSLSFDHPNIFGIAGDNNNSCADDEKIDEIVRALPEGSGMRELKDWLKSLRLHKYTRVLLEFTYEELLDVTEDQLDKKGVTLGARGKIFKNISLIKERPQRIQKLYDMLENLTSHNDMGMVCQILRELENYVLMPLKPYTAPPSNPIQTTSSRALTSATRTGRHDSGSDSGTDLCHDDENSVIAESTKNVPGLIFNTLKKVFMIILLSDTTNHEVITVFACLLERCRAKESFNVTQKKCFNSWLQKLRTLWNPPAIRKANDYKRRSFRSPADSSRRPSLHSFIRPVGQLPFKPSFPPSSAATTSTSGTSHVGHAMIHGPEQHHMEPHPEYAPPFSPRRSMPEIKPVTFSHFKRNSYQEDRRPTIQLRPNFFIDETEPSHLTSSIDFSSGINSFGFASPYSSSASLYNRRESTMSTDSGYLMSFPESRRDSSLSEFGVVGTGGNGTSASQHLINCVNDFAETCSGFGDRGSHFSCGNSASLFPPFSSAGVTNRRDSGLSLMTTSTFNEDYLTVPRRGSGCHGLHHGSISSGCVSDGSTDSLLEQDLHNLSLAVTQQALE